MKIKHDKKKESYPYQPIPVSQLTVDYTWSQVSSVERGGAGVLMFLPPLTRKQFHGFSKMISPKKSFPTQSTKASPVPTRILSTILCYLSRRNREKV